MTDRVKRYKYAYLVVFIRREDLRVEDVGIFSSGAGDLTADQGGYILADVVSAPAQTFGEAKQRLRDLVFSHPLHAWARPFLEKRDRRSLKEGEIIG